MPLIYVPQRITVANQRALPVVMEVVPAHCDPIASPDYIALPVIFIRPVCDIAREFVVVYPDSCAVLYCDAVVTEDMTNCQVS